MLSVLRALALAGFLFAAAGCASSATNTQTTGASAIPWNRPEKWEGTGMLGGMMQNN